MAYAGLTTADKGALLDAKARGAEWVARDADRTLCGYAKKPSKRFVMWGEGGEYWNLPTDQLEFIFYVDTEPVNIELALAQIAEMESKTINDVATDDIVLAEVYSLREKLKIAAGIIHQLDPNYDVTEFLHQVSSADFDQREEDLSPITWNDAINAMSIEEKAEWSMTGWAEFHSIAASYAVNYEWSHVDDGKPCVFSEKYVEKMTELLSSHYDGIAQEGVQA